MLQRRWCWRVREELEESLGMRVVLVQPMARGLEERELVGASEAQTQTVEVGED
jgi:hypothetical protein